MQNRIERLSYFWQTDRPADPTLQYRLALRQRIVSAGRHHSALIHNNQLYMWGDCFHHER